MILTFIKKYKFYLLIGVIAVTMFGIIGYQANRINSLKERQGELISKNEAFQVAEREWVSKIKEQNESIKELEETEKDLQQKLKESAEERREQQRRHERRIGELSSQDIPDTCEGSMDFLLDNAVQSREFNEDN